MFRLRAGLRCLPETDDLEYHERDPLLRWFEMHAHLVYRANLGQNQDHAQRELLRRALDTVGAEVIVPLQLVDESAAGFFLATVLPVNRSISRVLRCSCASVTRSRPC